MKYIMFLLFKGFLFVGFIYLFHILSSHNVEIFKEKYGDTDYTKWKIWGNRISLYCVTIIVAILAIGTFLEAIRLIFK